jgi:tetratricopeptide (TPR) repeat protein
MQWAVILVAGLAGNFSVGGCAGRAAKAERWLERAETEPAALTEAIARVDQAASSERAASDPEIQALRGRAYLRLAGTETGAARAEHLGVAVDSFERALAAGPEGAVHGQLSEAVPEAESLLMADLLNQVEAKAWDEADQTLTLVLRARAAATALRGADAERESSIRRLAVQIAAARGRLDEAALHYSAFATAAGRDDTPLACLVARAMAEQGDAARAIAFVSPLSAQHPDDEALLRAEVELRMGSGDKDGAVARIERSLDVLYGSVSGAFLAGSLYDAAGQPERARVAWRKVLELDGRHVDARVALGRSLGALAVEKRSELRERSEELDTRRPSREILDLVREVGDTWTEAEDMLKAAIAAEPRSSAAATALVALYEARVDGVDTEDATRDELAALEVDQAKLTAAREALAALGGTDGR